MNLLIEKLQADQRKLSIICFSLFSGWLLTIPFEGQVLYTIISNTQISGTIYNTIAVFAHFIGLFVSGFLIRRQISAKVTMITSTIVCISGSLIFFLPFSILWGISIISVSFFAGLFVASWGFYFKTYSEPDQRIKTAADVLIYSNLIMIFYECGSYKYIAIYWTYNNYYFAVWGTYNSIQVRISSNSG